MVLGLILIIVGFGWLITYFFGFYDEYSYKSLMIVAGIAMIALGGIITGENS